MRPSRWITFPLLMGVLLALPAVIIRNDSWPLELLFRFIMGIGIGFGSQAWSDHRTRKRAGNVALSDEMYSVQQTRTVTVFGDRQHVLDLCEKAVDALADARRKRVDSNRGEVTARVKMCWDSFGTVIKMNVLEIGESLCRVSIRTRPRIRTTRIDYGRSFEAAENLAQFLKKNDRSVDANLLRDGAEILVAATKRPLAKEFDRRMTGPSD